MLSVVATVQAEQRWVALGVESTFGYLYDGVGPGVCARGVGGVSLRVQLKIDACGGGSFDYTTNLIDSPSEPELYGPMFRIPRAGELGTQVWTGAHADLELSFPMVVANSGLMMIRPYYHALSGWMFEPRPNEPRSLSLFTGIGVGFMVLNADGIRFEWAAGLWTGPASQRHILFHTPVPDAWIRFHLPSGLTLGARANGVYAGATLGFELRRAS